MGGCFKAILIKYVTDHAVISQKLRLHEAGIPEAHQIL